MFAAVLVLYLTRKLVYDDDEATIIFHIFSMLVYFMCLFGATLSDSWLGKFKTILWLSIVYAIGSLILSLGAIPTLNLPGRYSISIYIHNEELHYKAIIINISLFKSHDHGRVGTYCGRIWWN